MAIKNPTGYGLILRPRLLSQSIRIALNAWPQYKDLKITAEVTALSPQTTLVDDDPQLAHQRQRLAYLQSIGRV